MRNDKSFKTPYETILLAMCLVVASAAASWAQFVSPRIGVLTPGLAYEAVFRGLEEELGRAGYRAGENITYTIEDTQGRLSNLGGRAKKLVDAKPQALFTVGTAHSLAAHQATTTLPIVFAYVADPVRAGLIAGYQLSKNNLTGVATYGGPLSAKRLEMLKEIAPATKRVLMIISSVEAPGLESVQPVEEAAKKLRIQLVRREAASKADIEKILAETPRGSVDAIFHFPSTLVGANIGALIKKAKEDKIPLTTGNDSMVEKGALFAYGTKFRLVASQAARLMAKVLNGERPSDIPVEVADKFFLTLNTTTAKTIGLKIPRAVLERVDRVVE
jgi:putative ABC transport system substrate-binding protein